VEENGKYIIKDYDKPWRGNTNLTKYPGHHEHYLSMGQRNDALELHH
jgi:hypothetical protein